MREVHLHDVDEAAFDEPADVLHRVRALARGDGQCVAARTDRYATGFSGGVGSSIHSGANGSSSFATAAAVADVKRPCISIMMPTSGPTASRTAATIAMARRRSGAGSSALA